MFCGSCVTRPRSIYSLRFCNPLRLKFNDDQALITTINYDQAFITTIIEIVENWIQLLKSFLKEVYRNL